MKKFVSIWNIKWKKSREKEKIFFIKSWSSSWRFKRMKKNNNFFQSTIMKNNHHEDDQLSLSFLIDFQSIFHLRITGNLYIHNSSPVKPWTLARQFHPLITVLRTPTLSSKTIIIIIFITFLRFMYYEQKVKIQRGKQTNR